VSGRMNPSSNFLPQTCAIRRLMRRRRSFLDAAGKRLHAG
jgi:hypothetical protein